MCKNNQKTYPTVKLGGFLLKATLGCFVYLISWQIIANDNSELSAEDILVNMADIYLSLDTYVDIGEVESTCYDGIQYRTTTRTFNTAFIRNEKFRFEYKEPKVHPNLSNHSVVLSQGDDIQVWNNIASKPIKFESMTAALLPVASNSRGAAHYVPKMLMPIDIDGLGMSDLKQAHRLSDMEMAGKHYFMIEALHPWGAPTLKLQIDQQTFLLHRLEIIDDFEQYACPNHVIRYQPQMNAEIDAQSLQFRMPGKN